MPAFTISAGLDLGSAASTPGVAVRKTRSLLLTLLLGAFTVKVLWWVVAPFIPYLVSLLAVVLVLGFIYYRMTRW